MSYSYGGELCIYESLSSIAEPLEVIVILNLKADELRINQHLHDLSEDIIHNISQTETSGRIPHRKRWEGNVEMGTLGWERWDF